MLVNDVIRESFLPCGVK